jgi:Flp pilus assembly protein TadB
VAVPVALCVVAFLLHKLVFFIVMVAAVACGTGLGFAYVLRRDRKQREERERRQLGEKF